MLIRRNEDLKMNKDAIWLAVFFLFVITFSVWLGEIMMNYVNQRVKDKRLKIAGTVLAVISVLCLIFSTIAKSISFRTSVTLKMQALDDWYNILSGVGVIAVIGVVIILYINSQTEQNKD